MSDPNSKLLKASFDSQATPKTVAFFDVDGTLLKSTIVHYYIWMRSAEMPFPAKTLVAHRFPPEDCLLPDFG